MKNIALYLVCTLFITFSPVFAQTGTEAPQGPYIKFSENSFDFGDIYQGDTVSHVFKFKNTGNAPLLLKEVLTTCGCTVPKFSKDPILPGKESEIVVKFNSEGKEGRMTKPITVISNSTNSPARITIITNILPKKK
ncbi:MAG: DUF1573 domain-containing protein [Cytophagaceae bacterium]